MVNLSIWLLEFGEHCLLPPWLHLPFKMMNAVPTRLDRIVDAGLKILFVQLTTFVLEVRDLARKKHIGTGLGETLVKRVENFVGNAFLKADVEITL